MKQADSSKSVERCWLPWLLAAQGFAVYINGLFGPFIFDDLDSIVENPSIRALWPIWKPLTAPSPDLAVSGRPVVSLSLALNYALGGLDSWGYHLFNICIHVLAGLVLYGLIRRSLQTHRLKARHGYHAEWMACIVALLWLVHPLQTEAVSYVVQRTELIMGLCLLLTLYCVLRGATAQDHSRTWYAAAVGACAVGMGSKEVMVVAPLLVWLFDGIFLSRSYRKALHRRRKLYVALALTWIILLGLLATEPRRETAGLRTGVMTSWQYLTTQGGVLLHYFRLALWPHPLVIDYSDWPIAQTVADWAGPALIISLLLALTVYALYRRQPLGFLGAWVFLILAPTSSLVPIITEPSAERRMYLPLAAWLILLTLGGWWCLSRLRVSERARQSLAIGLVTALVTVLGAATIRRNVDYQSELAIWSDTVRKRPMSAWAHNNLGVVYLRERTLDQAIEQFTISLSLQPSDAKTLNNMGAALGYQEKFDKAIEYFTASLRIRPGYAMAHSNLGAMLAKQEKFDQAIAEYRTALQFSPEYASARNNLGVLLASQGKFEEAMKQYARALASKPDYAETHDNWGLALLEVGRIREAIDHFREAERIRPGYADAQAHLKSALAQLAQTGEGSPDPVDHPEGKRKKSKRSGD